jgi:hypothetical protein
MQTIVKRGAYTLAVVAYTFFASGYLARALSSLPSAGIVNPTISSALGLVEISGFSVVLAPLCVLVANWWRRFDVLLLCYCGLAYIGLLGQAIIGHERLAFDAPPGLVVPWQTQATNSFVFLAIVVLLNFPPTFLIWGLASVLVARRQSQTRRKRA